ncbi:la-related protein 6-like [Antedon mediterranea]|uniref:la-related protein 6-like n=1 Tax=Antedon mediterranea TaxID=105859 RepID=UPI003AF45262
MSEINALNIAVHGSEADEKLAMVLSKTPPPLVHISRVKEEGRAATDGSEIDSFDSQASLSESDDEQFVDAEEDLNVANKENGLKKNEKRVKSDIENNNNKPWQPPDEELQEKIVKQVEFYFSDTNITKDAFLLKHVKRNREGYVSLKLITSFKKVKKLTKDWRSVRHSLQQRSVSLVVNPDGKKVKRKDPLPEYDETTPSRTVIVVNLPSQNPTIENVNELFKECGEISLVRIIRPGKSVPPDIRKHMGKHYDIGNTLCALVEFEKSESALNAVKLMSNDDNWRTGMHVTLLAPKKNKKEPGKTKEDGQTLSPQQRSLTPVGSGAESDGSMKGDEKRRRRRNKRKNRVEELVNEGGDNSSSEPELSPSTDRRQQSKPVAIPQARSPNLLSPATTPKSSPVNSPHSSPRVQKKSIGRSPLAESNRASPKNSPKGSPESKYKYNDGSPPEGSSPWVRRRRLLAAESSPAAGNSPVGSPKMMRHSAALSGIIRNPRGPDGTHGFACSKGRGKFISVC